MHGKYFIFKTKYQKQLPTLIRFKSHLCQQIQIEKQIYFIKDRLAQFYNKWGTLRVSLSINYKTTLYDNTLNK